MTVTIFLFALGSFLPVLGLLFFIFLGPKTAGKVAAISCFGGAALVLGFAALREMLQMGTNPTF